MKTKKLFSTLLVIISLLHCSSPQRPLRPTPYTVDVVLAPVVDYDAYHVSIPPPEDAGLIIANRGNPNELVAPLRQNQPAPFPGVLFNGPVLARVEVEFRGQQEQCRIDRQRDVDILAARALTDIRLLQTSINAQGSSYRLMLESRDVEIERLYNQLLSTSQQFPVWQFALGLSASLVVGTALGTLLGFGLSR
jgi:hypothetical protein